MVGINTLSGNNSGNKNLNTSKTGSNENGFIKNNKLINNKIPVKQVKQESTSVLPVFFAEKKEILSCFVAIDSSKTDKQTDKALLNLLENLIDKKKITQFHQLFLAGEAFKKGFANEATLVSFLNLVKSVGDENRKEGQQQREKRSTEKKEIKNSLKSAVSSAEEQNNLLFVFNHLSEAVSQDSNNSLQEKSKQEQHKHWIIIPFAFGEQFTSKTKEAEELTGTLRLAIVLDKVSEIVIHAEKKENLWFFTVKGFDKTEETGKYLKIYSNKEGKKFLEKENYKILLKKLQNLGIKTDDNIYDALSFSGFSATGLQNVDFKV